MAKSGMSREDAPLHSTMFLLIPRTDRFCVASLHFTFHNVSINTEKRHRISLLRCYFTFHNVSINTMAVYLIALVFLSVFTFHNVSINTIIRKILFPAYWSLHSTLFLLIREEFVKMFGRNYSLHSTMFLLIPTIQYVEENNSVLYIPQCFY